MTVTAAANTLKLNSVIAATIDNIDVISLSTAAGEQFRKAPQNIEVISPTKRKYIFFITEAEGNGDLTKLSLYGDGATTALGDGVEMCDQAVDIEKTASRSLLVNWTVEVI